MSTTPYKIRTLVFEDHAALARVVAQRIASIVRATLEELKPDLIFVAGDLSDPHGTHRVCKEAIDRAVTGSAAAQDPGDLHASIQKETAAPLNRLGLAE